MHKNRKIINSGTKFGKLLVICDAGTQNSSSLSWCVCECGKLSKHFNKYLLKGDTKSCGCYLNQQTKANKIYKTYHSMIQRCYNNNTFGFEHYGGRGIKVCDRWLESFANFLEDMGERSQGMTLDRIDVNCNYCKENCRWANRKTQANNRRNNNIIEYKGEKLTVSQWADKLHISPQIIKYRLNNNWSIEKTLLTKVKEYNYV